MTRPNLATIMRRAHEIARTLEGDYRARLAFGMRAAWAEAKKPAPRPQDYWLAAEKAGRFDIVDAHDFVRANACRNVGTAESDFMGMTAGRETWAGANAEERAWLRGKLFGGTGYGVRGGYVANACQMFDNA